MLTAKSLTCVLPEGKTLFSRLNFTLEKKKYGLVGANGAGKTTLVRLLAREMVPTAGVLIGHVPVIHLRQFEERKAITVGEYLLDIWSTGFINSPLYGYLLGSLDMASSITTLSGGEWMRVRLALAAGAAEGGILAMDEPTNNLDRLGREALYQFVERYEGGLLIISHDRELLQKMGEIWELSNQGIQCYGGNYSFYEESKQQESDRLEEAIDVARIEKKKQEREHREKLDRQRKRIQWAKSNLENMGLPRIVAQARKRQAQQSLGRINKEESQRNSEREEQFKTLYQQRKNLSQWRLEFPHPEKRKGHHMVFSLSHFNYRYPGQQRFLWTEPLNFTLYAHERLYLRGQNGSGKTTLLRLLMSPSTPLGEFQGVLKTLHEKWLYLDQEYSLLSPEKTILENLRDDGLFSVEELRNRLAEFGFVSEDVFKRGKVLSGGEKLRACLAKLVLSAHNTDVLILDEPTNNLDLESILLLEKALKAYQGTLILVTHDETLSQKIDCGRELNLNNYGPSRI